MIRVEVEGGDNLPTTGPASIVANRGFGIAEPAVLGIAVRRSVARRLRIVGAPSVPVLSGIARRLGAISASAPDMRACLRAGNLCGALSTRLPGGSAGTPSAREFARLRGAR